MRHDIDPDLTGAEKLVMVLACAWTTFWGLVRAAVVVGLVILVWKAVM